MTQRPFRLVDLRTEYLPEPLGLDVTSPRLSWRMEAADSNLRGLRQAAYRVVVASSKHKLDEADQWDSGLVHSSQSTLVEYRGKPLTSNAECWWRVQVTDNQASHDEWSEPAHWTMGLLHTDEWRGKWIGAGGAFAYPPKSPNYIVSENTVPDPWLRKEIDLEGTPARAVMYVASIGYHELYVNGVLVGDAVLQPSVSDHLHRARYVTYEIAHLFRPGRNTICLWLGVSWSIFPPYLKNGRPATPMALAQGIAWLKDGSEVRFETDETWLTHPSPNHLLGVWDFMNYGGERYDAREEIPGWNLVGTGTSGWEPVTVYAPDVTISAQILEPNRTQRTLTAASVMKGTDDTHVIDMGVNFAGWVEIPVWGHPGDEIRFQFSEREGTPETHKLHSAYVIGPTGRGVFRNRFNYMSGRWITVHGLDGPPKKESIKAWNVRSDYEQTASFECSDPMLNRIYRMSLWTFENLSLGGYVVDCPQRERMGYGGDAHATTQTALMSYGMGPFYTKWAQDWRDVQSSDGDLPYTAPTYWGGGGPAWSGFCIHLPWEVYLHYGDVRILHDNYPTIKRWLAFLETKAQSDLLVKWGGEWDFLGDWLWPGTSGTPNSELAETQFFNNCYWAHALDIASRIAGLLGLGTDAQQYDSRARQIRAAIRSKFSRPETHDYAAGDQQYLAAALLAQVPLESERDAVMARLEEEILVHRGGHIHAGITGGALLFRYLLDQHRADLLYSMVGKVDFPSWGHFINQGFTTFPEDWNGDQSHLHSSYEFVGAWFLEGLVGIGQLPDSAGYRHVILRPLIAETPKLDHVSGSYRSPRGTIHCGWKRSGESVSITVTVPPNSQATIYVPSSDPASISEGGIPASQSKGIRVGLARGGTVPLELESGTYRIETRIAAGSG